MESRKDSFDIGFDEQIPEDVKNELRRFIKWFEENHEEYEADEQWADAILNSYLQYVASSENL